MYSFHTLSQHQGLMDDIDDFLSQHPPSSASRLPPLMRGASTGSTAGATSFSTGSRAPSMHTPGAAPLFDDDAAVPTVVRSLPFTPPGKSAAARFGSESPHTSKFTMSPPEEITTEKGRGDTNHGGSATGVAAYLRTPQSKAQQSAHSKKSSAAGSETPAVAKYFNLLRQMHDSPTSGDEHPQNHIINRKFRLTSDRDGSCTIARVAQASADGSEFSHEEEISAAVNISDAALVRLISVRTSLSTERAGFRTLCEATATLSAKIGSGLTAFTTPSSAGATDAPQQEGTQAFDDADPSTPVGRHGATPPPPPPPNFEHNDDDRLWEASKSLLKALGGQHEATINSVVGHATECTQEERNAILAAMETLIEEARVAPRAVPKESTFEGVSAEVEAMLRREHEAKTHGNLAYGASLRRDLIHRLRDGLRHATEELQSTDAHVDEVALRRSATDAMLKKALANIEERVSALETEAARTAARTAESETALKTLEVQCTQRTSELMQFLSGNETEVMDVVAQIDALYAKLETLVHHRAKSVKDFIQQHGAHVLRRADVAERHQRDVASVAERRASLSGKQRFLGVMRELRSLREPVRATVDAKLATAVAEASGDRAKLATDCERLSAELRHFTANWIDVLMKNSAREAERAVVLQAQIRDATERYDQQDKNMYMANLEECLARKEELQREVAEFQEILSEAQQQQQQHSAMNASFASVGGGGGFNATPMSTPQRGVFGANRPRSPPPVFPLHSAAGPLVAMNDSHIGECGDEPAPVYTLLDVDRLTVDEFVPLFRKSAATTAKWIEALRDIDVETVGDLRDIKRTPVWESFLLTLPLLKTHIEMLLESPERFLQ